MIRYLIKISQKINQYESGMTLVELIVAMTIVVIMLAGTVVFLPYYRDNQALKQGSLDLNDSLRYAQTKSLSQNEEEYTVWKVLTDATEPTLCVIQNSDYSLDQICQNLGKKFTLSNKLNIVTNVPEIFFQGKSGMMYNSPDFENASLISGEARLIHINHDRVGDMYYGVVLDANSFSVVQGDVSDATFETDPIIVCSNPNAVNYGAKETCQLPEEDTNTGDGQVTPPIVAGCTVNSCPTGQQCIDGTCHEVVQPPVYQCQSDTQCGTNKYCANGQCFDKQGVGGNCEVANACTNGLECVISPVDQIKKCLLPISSTCSSSNSCATGLCFAGKCANYAPIGARCELAGNLSNCVSGSTCQCITGRFGQTCTCK